MIQSFPLSSFTLSFVFFLVFFCVQQHTKMFTGTRRKRDCTQSFLLHSTLSNTFEEALCYYVYPSVSAKTFQRSISSRRRWCVRIEATARHRRERKAQTKIKMNRTNIIIFSLFFSSLLAPHYFPNCFPPFQIHFPIPFLLNDSMVMNFHFALSLRGEMVV